MDQAMEKILTEHLHYEHDMLDRAYDVLTSPEYEKERSDQFWYNAVIEVFWVHARCLIEFYSNPKGASASASDFTTGPLQPEFKLKKGAPAVDNEGKKFSDLINQQICHLKYERVSSWQEKLGGYDVLRMKGAIDRARKKFERMLTSEAGSLFAGRLEKIVYDGSVTSSSATMSIVSTSTASIGAAYIKIAD